MPFAPALLHRITPSSPLSSLALPPTTLGKLRAICASLRVPAPRIPSVALFLSPTPQDAVDAALALAHDLGQKLLRIDLSQIVSPDIAETEKNLADLIQTADPKQWVLFFDEADALFGKRSEIHDAHDRFAAIESSYLLRQLHCFRGLAILATTAPTNPIPGKLIHYIVHLPQRHMPLAI
ncbi:MAG: hypothetical protein NVSMB3_00040 [Acidobacteriaceae bacterium]